MTAGTAEPLRALVTGATGFIGAHLCRRLEEAGETVFTVSRRATSGSRHVVADLTDPVEARRVIEQTAPDVVYHLASAVTGARDLAAVWPTFAANAGSAVAVMAAAAAAGCPRVVLAGSMEEPRPPDATPASPYAAAKAAAGTYADLFRSSYGLAVVHLRIFMVYGPGQADRSKLVPAAATALLRGEVPALGTGARRVDWIYVDDVVDALVAAGSAEPAPAVAVDVGSGSATTIREVVEMIGRITGVDPTAGFGRRPDRPRETEPVADVATADRLLGWRPRTPLADGLAETVAWYAAHGLR